MDKSKLDTYQKALQVNLDPTKYGTIAEIGAGQEVARWFFRVGAAAGTIAKTISAYDMGVSDAIYGKSSRYVSHDRVLAMLDYEWQLLIERLDDTRGGEATFFAFADTISARNYQGTNICHGWMGIRFQSEPRGKPNTICVHVNMHDDTNYLQQLAIGVLGVNLIHAAVLHPGSLPQLMAELLDELSLKRTEVDCMSVDGPLFEKEDKHAVLLALLENKLTEAVGFSASGQPIEPMAFIYKCPVVLERGTFAAADPIYGRILKAAGKQLQKEGVDSRRAVAEVFEMTTNSANKIDAISSAQVLNRLEGLFAFKRPIIVSAYAEGYRVTKLLRRYTSEPIRFAMGISHLVQVFGPQHYEHLRGGIVEGLGRLIATGVRIYVCAMDASNLRQHLEACNVDLHGWHQPEDGMASISNTKPVGAERHLYSYLLETGALLPLDSEDF